MQFEPIATLPGLSFGAYVGAEAWFANQGCSTSGTAAPVCTEVSDATNLAFQGGLSARFVLPLSLVPPPPKPPTAEYILVRSRLQVATSDSMDPEVTDTEAYRSALPRVKRVALAAPDYCASKTAANTTGQAAHTDSVVQTKCGVEMSEIERALTKEGYAVHSWTTLDAMVRDGKLTARDAAAKLGAQVLFQVNSLEHVQAQPSTQARWERTYFASNEYGTQGPAVQPTQGDLVSLHPLMQQPELAALPGVVQGAMLDVNAILVESGQTIWFYRWQRLDTASTGSEVSALAQKMSDDVAWRAVVPRPSGTVQPAPAPVESASFQSNGGPASAKDARYFQLMREVVTDFVRRFTTAGRSDELSPRGSGGLEGRGASSRALLVLPTDVRGRPRRAIPTQRAVGMSLTPLRRGLPDFAPSDPRLTRGLTKGDSTMQRWMGSALAVLALGAGACGPVDDATGPATGEVMQRVSDESSGPLPRYLTDDELAATETDPAKGAAQAYAWQCDPGLYGFTNLPDDVHLPNEAESTSGVLIGWPQYGCSVPEIVDLIYTGVKHTQVTVLVAANHYEGDGELPEEARASPTPSSRGSRRSTSRWTRCGSATTAPRW